MDNSHITPSDLKQMSAGLFRGSAESAQQANERMEKMDKRTEKMWEETDRRIEENNRLIKENIREIKEMRNTQNSADRRMKELTRKLDNFGIVLGEIAEDLFRRNVRRLLAKEKMKLTKSSSTSRRMTPGSTISSPSTARRRLSLRSRTSCGMMMRRSS